MIDKKMIEKITIKQIGPYDSQTDGAQYGSFDSRNNQFKLCFCTNMYFAKMDLGDRQKEYYDQLFPEGWEVVGEWENER